MGEYPVEQYGVIGSKGYMKTEADIEDMPSLFTSSELQENLIYIKWQKRLTTTSNML